MSPILPIAAAFAAMLLLRRKPRARPSSPPDASPPPPSADGEGESPPAPPKKPGKDYVADVGLGSRGTKPPPKGGGFTAPEPGDGDPPAPPPSHPGDKAPQPPAPQPPGHAVGHQIPAPLHFEESLASVDMPHEVLLADQLGNAPLPSGRWRVRMVFVATVSAPKLVSHPTTYGWDYSVSKTYTQRETIDYEITIDGSAGAIVKKSQSTKWLDGKLQPFMFGCKTKQECGWNGSYTSFFHPRLVWNNGIEARFDTRELAVDPEQAGINFTGVTIDVSFAEAP